jgi:hypothetical protein
MLLFQQQHQRRRASSVVVVSSLMAAIAACCTISLNVLLLLSLATSNHPGAVGAVEGSSRGGGEGGGLSVSSFWKRRWHKNNKNYTPLLFFTVPPGIMPECDAMEKTVRMVEQELGVHVERRDVVRNPANEAVLNQIVASLGSSGQGGGGGGGPQLLQNHGTPPFLYHRESLQSVSISPSSGSSKTKKKTPQHSKINRDRVRAWAKGRLVPPAGPSMQGANDAAALPVLLMPQEDINDDDSINHSEDAVELLEDMALSPEQLRGKRLMQERTDAKARANTKSTKE